MKRIFFVLLMVLISIAPVAAANVPVDATSIDPQSIAEIIRLITVLVSGGGTVAIIVSLTLVSIQMAKPYLPAAIPRKAIAIGLGMGLTALAVFVFHWITGPPVAVFIEVFVAILGAPAVFEILKGK